MPRYHTYQVEAIDKTIYQLSQNEHPLVCAPTGAGKTWMMTGIVRHFLIQNQTPILILCSRKEVAIKVRETIVEQLEIPPAVVGLLFSGAPKGLKGKRKITVATYQSASLLVKSGIGLTIVDEAHHSRATHLEKLLTNLKDAGSQLCGFTATPFRTDNKTLLKVFTTVVDSETYSTYEGVTLSPYVVKVFPVANLLDVVQKSGYYRKQGDYFRSPLILNQVIQIVKNHFDSGEISRAILYAVDQPQARLLCQLLKAIGLRSEALVSAISRSQRESIFKTFSEGGLDVICNVRILEDGVDFPECDAVILASGFGSLNQYLQACGRALRFVPGKVATVLDFSGATLQHGSPRIPRLPKFDFEFKPRTRKCKGCEEKTPYPLQYKQHTEENGKVSKWWECPHCDRRHYVLPKDSLKRGKVHKQTPKISPLVLEETTQQVLSIAQDVTLTIEDRIDRLGLLAATSTTPIPPAAIYLGLRLVSPTVSDAIAKAVSGYSGESLEHLVKTQEN